MKLPVKIKTTCSAMLQGFRSHWLLYLLLIVAAFVEPLLVVYGSTGFEYTYMNFIGVLFSVGFALPLQLLIISVMYFFPKISKVWSCVLCWIYSVYIVSSIFIYVNFKTIWNRSYYDLIAITHFDEIVNFFIAFWLEGIIAVGLIVLIGVFVTRHLLKTKPLQTKSARWCGVVLLVPTILLLLFSSVMDEVGGIASAWVSLSHKPIAVRGIRLIFTDDMANDSVAMFADLQKNMKKPLNLECRYPSMNGIVLLGESATRGHMSVYGYDRNTTPYMLARKDEWICYQDVISPFNATMLSCRCMFTDA
ncbi:MAG: hypothetical protein MJ025_07040, partial [Victivallaceae bacterium]|nr:hypothetical protein [Victivallaceae bacterium]